MSRKFNDKKVEQFSNIVLYLILIGSGCITICGIAWLSSLLFSFTFPLFFIVFVKIFFISFMLGVIGLMVFIFMNMSDRTIGK